MGMQPQEEYTATNKVDPTISIQNFVDEVLSEARGIGAGIMGSIKRGVGKENTDAQNMNREMIRQLLEREDIQHMLNLREKGWRLNIVETIFSVFSVGFISVLFVKRPILAFLVFLIGFFVVLSVNALKGVNAPKKFEKLLREIAGSDAHMKVLEDMLRNTPYSTRSGNADGWIYREMLNFRERDKEFKIKENIQQKSNSLKADLLRNINKE